jgi:uncharacterized protein YxjI
MAAYQLHPMPQQIGFFDHYVARQTEMLILREKVLSLSGDSFDITMANGQPIFRVQGSVMSLSGRKSFFDMNNHHLFDICREHMHIHTTYALLDPQGTKIMELKNSFSRM